MRQLQLLTAFAIVVTTGIWLNILYYSWFPLPFGWRYPDNTFQTLQVSRFSDFYDMIHFDRARDPYDTVHTASKGDSHVERVGTAYPPFANLFYYLLSRLSADDAGTGTGGASKAQDYAFWLFVGFPFIAFPVLVLFWINPNNSWLFGLLVVLTFNLSYPMLFALDRGNLELSILPLITAFAWLHDSASKSRRYIAATVLGMAIALKLYPILFLFLYLKRRKWSSAFIATVVCLVLTIASYFAFRGSFMENVAGHLHFIKSTSGKIAIDLNWATRYSSSLFSFLYLSARALLNSNATAEWIRHHFIYFQLPFFVIVLMFLAARALSNARLFASLCCLAILATPESPDYKLLLLFPAAIGLITDNGGTRVFNLLFVSLVGLLLIPKNWIMIFDEVSYGSIINPFLVISFLLLLMFAPNTSAPRRGFEQIDAKFQR
jgi:hypothetical protein